MGKYEPLGAFLRSQPMAEVPLSFRDIEAIVGAPLPPRAQHQRAWWSNNASNNVMTKEWLNAGFRTERVDLAARRLVFRRADTHGVHPRPWRQGDPIPLVNGRHPIFGSMKGTITIAPGVDLTEPACPEWASLADRETV